PDPRPARRRARNRGQQDGDVDAHHGPWDSRHAARPGPDVAGPQARGGPPRAGRLAPSGLRRGVHSGLGSLPGPHHRYAEDGLMALPLSYNVRNVRVRWQVTLLAISGIALVVAAFAVLMAMAEGFATALRSTGRRDNAIIVQRGSNSELTSAVPLDQRNVILADSRVARGADGQPLASWDWGIVMAMPKRIDGTPTNVALRAVSPAAFDVRGGVRVVEGRSFTPGTDEVIVGRKIRDRIRGLDLNGTVRYERKEFKIVGVFEADGPAFESEIWGDYATMGSLFERGGGSNSVVARLKDPSDVASLDRWIRAQPQMQLRALSERKYYEDQAGNLSRTLRMLANLVAVIMGVGAVFGAMNTMYAI